MRLRRHAQKQPPRTFSGLWMALPKLFLLSILYFHFVWKFRGRNRIIHERNVVQECLRIVEEDEEDDRGTALEKTHCVAYLEHGVCVACIPEILQAAANAETDVLFVRQKHSDSKIVAQRFKGNVSFFNQNKKGATLTSETAPWTG